MTLATRNLPNASDWMKYFEEEDSHSYCCLNIFPCLRNIICIYIFDIHSIEYKPGTN